MRKTSLGAPLILQILAALCSRGCLNEELLRGRATSSQADVLNSLLEEWLIHCVRNPVTEEILETLCRIPFAGMNADALAAVNDASPSDIVKGMRPLLDRGAVIATRCASGGDEVIYSAHDQIRSGPLGTVTRGDKTVISKQRRYLGYLKTQLDGDATMQADTLTCIDAWISGWTSVFQQLDANQEDRAFEKGLEEYSKLLPHLVRASQDWAPMVLEIETILMERIDPQMFCAPLTALGHLLRDMPQSYTLAEAMWKAAHNYDGWGRASAIGVSVSHWTRLSDRGAASWT